jgi:tape measure domain-containing protein
MPSIANAIAVGIGMDTKQLRKDVNYANRIIGQSKAAFRDLGKTLELINLDYKEGTITQNEYTAAVNKAVLASEKKTAQLKQEAATVKALEAANLAASAAERKRVQDSLGVGSYSGAKPGSSTSSGSVNSYLNAGSSKPKNTDSLGLGSYSGATAKAATGGGVLNGYINAAKTARDAALAAQEPLTGWENGLKQLGLSKFAQDLARSQANADTWAAGMRNIANATKKATEATDALKQEGVGYLRQFENSQQRVNRQLNEARGYFKSGAITGQQYAQAVRQIQLQNSAVVTGFNQFRGVMLTLVGPLVLTIKTYEALKRAITLSAELDAARAKFRVFTGSAVEAESVLRDIRSLSSESPVSFEGGQRAVTTMLQFGVASKNVVTSLRQIAEITGGDTARMESLALAFAQSQAAGRLMGQELLQMVNAGFNPLKVISEQTGQSLVELKKQMEDGGISAEAVAKAFKDATGEGGKFNGLLNEIAETTAGKITRAGTEVDKLSIAFGDLIKPATDGSLELFTGLVKDLTSLFNALNGVQKQYSLVDDIKEQIKYYEARSSDWFNSDKTQAEEMLKFYQSQLKTLQNIDGVRERIANGGFVTKEEKALVDRIDRDKRNETKRNQSEYDQLKAQLEKDLKAAKTPEERARKQVDFIDTVGTGRETDAEVARIDALRKQLEGYDADAAKAKRATESFKGAIDKLKESQIESQYGNNANRVSLLREQSTDTERKQIDNLLAQGAAYSQIYAAANQAAQAEADRLAILEDANRAEVFRQELDNLESQAKYLEEAVTWGKEEARLRQLMRDDGLSRSEAELKRAAEDRLKAEEKIKELRDTAKALKEDSTNFDKLVNGVAELQALLQLGFIDQSIFDREANKLASSADQKYGTASAPRAIQAGSAEAFALQAENQAKVISENIRLANRAFTVQKATSEAAKKTSDILDDIKDNLGVLPTP